MTVLVVAAHPDDETLGAGGSIARFTAAGRPVSWLVLGEGTTSRSSAGVADHLEAQAAECRTAAAILGVQDVQQDAFPDNRFDAVDLLDVVKVVEAAIDRVRPTLVLTHHGHDLNVDHRRTHDAVVTATRPLPGSPVATVLAFEVVSSTEWAFGRAPFTPNVFIDISATLDAKLRAVRAYRSELRAAPHPRSPEGVAAWAAARGATAGVAAAEAFELVRAVR